MPGQNYIFLPVNNIPVFLEASHPGASLIISGILQNGILCPTELIYFMVLLQFCYHLNAAQLLLIRVYQALTNCNSCTATSFSTFFGNQQPKPITQVTDVHISNLNVPNPFFCRCFVSPQIAGTIFVCYGVCIASEKSSHSANASPTTLFDKPTSVALSVTNSFQEIYYGKKSLFFS